MLHVFNLSSPPHFQDERSKCLGVQSVVVYRLPCSEARDQNMVPAQHTGFDVCFQGSQHQPQGHKMENQGRGDLAILEFLYFRGVFTIFGVSCRATVGGYFF